MAGIIGLINLFTLYFLTKMKLKAFRVFRYRSIIDSGDCYLSPNDGITILAGQNESGKSSLLEALKHYEDATPCPEAYRDEDISANFPWVRCVYEIEQGDDIYSEILNAKENKPELKQLLESEIISGFIKGLTEIAIDRIISYDTSKYQKPALSRYASYGDFVKKAIAENEISKTVKETDVRFAIGYAVFMIAPKIILFDDFFDLLPDKFYIDDLRKSPKPKGLQAVHNVEAILETDFSNLAKLVDYRAIKQQREYEKTLTADFNERWRQRVGDETGATISVTYQQGGKEEGPYLRFFIQTREGEYLAPEKRSQGFKWFLSFYLHLTAENKSGSSSVLLFDEPGLHLHSKAQYDMLQVFEELSKNNKIIYATHSPYLIDADKLHRVRLVFNTSDKGTTVEKITTKLSGNQKDAMKPIIDAMGMSVAHDFSAAKQKNIIVEGISDYYYFTASKKLMNIDKDFYFMPAMGASNAHLLMELCIGWGLTWLMIFDDSKDTAKDIKKIKTQFFSDDNIIDNKIHVITGCDGIEDIFEVEDIKLAAPEFTRTLGPISKDLKSSGGKELIGRFFLDKVESGEITWDKLSLKAQNHLKEIFSFIEKGFQ